jgi:hypothetical protein
MQWNFLRKPARGKGLHKKTRSLRLELVEQRQMLTGGSPFFLHAGPPAATVAGEVVQVDVSASAPRGGQTSVHVSESIATSASRGGSDVIVQESSRVSTQVQAGGVTQVTVDETERVYVGGNAGFNHPNLVAVEDVRVVADIHGAGHLQLDVNECESLVAQGGRGLSVEELAQGENVSANFSGAGRLNLIVNESETISAQSQDGHGVAMQLASQSEYVGLGFAGWGNLALNAGESQWLVVRPQVGPRLPGEAISPHYAVDAHFAGVGRVPMIVRNPVTGVHRVGPFREPMHRPHICEPPISLRMFVDPAELICRWRL